MKCMVLGAYGLLGAALCDQLSLMGHEVTRAGRRREAQIQLNPLEQSELDGHIKKNSPDVVINLVAKTNVDECEKDPEAAFSANTGVVAAICEVLDTKPNIHLIHISTDQVYEGLLPHSESTVRPINVYGITKYAGELIAEKIGGTILRCNFVGRSLAFGRVGLSDWIINSLLNQEPIILFKDVVFSPVHVSTLCFAIERVVSERIGGIFNVGAHGKISKADFGLRLAYLLNLSPKEITIGLAKNHPFLARRPSGMVMDSTKFEDAFNFPLPSIDDEIKKVAYDYLPNTGVNSD